MRGVSRVPKDRLVSMIQELFNEQNEELIGELIEDLPNGWERFDDGALLPLNAFSNSRWDLISRETLWENISIALNVKRLFRKVDISGERRES